MSKALIEAVSIISRDFRRANIDLIGKLPPLLTIQFPTILTEAQYWSYMRDDVDQAQAHIFDRSRSGFIAGLRENCVCEIDRISVRLNNDERMDDLVRRYLK